jgi:hypothetical protein
MKPTDDEEELRGVAFTVNELEAAARWSKSVKLIGLRWVVAIDHECADELGEVYGRRHDQPMWTVVKWPDGAIDVVDLFHGGDDDAEYDTLLEALEAIRCKWLASD